MKRSPKLVIGLAGCSVMLVFIAALSPEKTKRYHSDDEAQGYMKMLEGDLPNMVSDMFIGSGKCAGCHGVDNSTTPIANLTTDGENVSPAENWRATMMANSAKDPFWKAKVAHEVSVNPGHAGEITNTCTSCHAPLGRFEAIHDGIENYTMEMLATDTLARDGVSCMACHSQQIETTGFFFSGDLHYNADTVWGPQLAIGAEDPPLFSYIMQSFVLVEPVPSTKFSQSETCAGCHTLLTHTADLEGELTGTNFIEQATYHEWLNSAYNMEEEQNQQCQGCHMPKLDEPIILASGYSFLPHREPYSQHWFVGGNTFMLELMKNRINELGITANEGHFNKVIDRTMNNLQNETASLVLTENTVDGDTARYTVKVANKAGHKFPSGYPSRRSYIEFVMTDDEGNEIFHSGKMLPNYEVQGQNADMEPHYETITNDEEEVQIYELVMGDVLGNVTTVLERADHPLKDNRLVPLGFSTTHAAYDTTMIIGPALDDPNFNHNGATEGTGTDIVHYNVPVSGISGNVHVTARLMFQALPPKWNNELFSVDHPDINAFEEMYLEEGADPVEVATDDLSSTLVDVQEFAGFFRVSPNPTSTGQVMVDAGKDRIVQINVYAMNGKLIESINANNASRKQFYIEGNAGTYLLDVTTSRGRRVEKVMKR